MSTAEPPGKRNKNYLNVKNAKGDPWQDAGGELAKSDNRGHAIFTDAAWGVRAGLIVLRTYFFTHQLRTIAGILARWAPASDTVGSLPGGPPNSPKEYSQFVSGRTGLDPNQRLEIFDEDRTIGNLGQLRALFYAMAAYEVGGDFVVPDKDFNSGVDLVEPGTSKNGTGSTYDTSSVDPKAAKAATAWSITGSVGKSGGNDKADVETVQHMLRSAAMILSDPSVDPGGIDGSINKNAKKSPTIQAIMAFQGRFLTKPDGTIEPGGRTWKELTGVLVSGPQTAETLTLQPTGAGPFFPMAKVPAQNWWTAPRSFGANRSNGTRAHAGCDLYAPMGTIIYAVADGVVLRGPVEFYAKTFVLEVDHGDFIARYGEVQADTFVQKGDVVRAGQAIAKVGHLQGIVVPSDMLHFELYSKTAQGPLTVSVSESLIASDGRPFLRRKDLIDPTQKLKTWSANLPSGPAVPHAAAVAAAAAPKPLPKRFEIRLKRVRQEVRPGKAFARTVGEYQCFWDGEEIAGLQGQIVERGGPGDNTTNIGNNYDRRIKKGTYPLSVHHGANYRTLGYDGNISPNGHPKPGILLEDTGERSAILIHPGVDYLSSVGCLNPATDLKAAGSRIDFADSRKQVIAIIDTMKAKLGSSFPNSGTIPNAFIVIDGEPV